MSLEEPKFVDYIKKLFSSHSCDYEIIKSKFNAVYSGNTHERDRMATYSHFYYFICTPERTEPEANSTREELQIVGMTSLIEAMMEDVEYMDVFAYFKSEFKDKNTIEDFRAFEADYLGKYGATKKIVNYFDKYISKEDAIEVVDEIRVWSDQSRRFESLGDLERLARLLYQMRNDFVHKARMQSFCPTNISSSSTMIGHKIYNIRVDVGSVLRIFEKSFVNYWQKKYNELI